MKRAILINPEDMTITEIKIETKLSSYHEMIGCELIEFVRMSPTVELIIDEEGRCREDNKYFMFASYPVPLAGKALIIGGEDEEGGNGECTLTLEEAVRSIRWVR